MALLTTKLYRPRTRSNVVVRTRLFTQLNEAIEAARPLVMVSAPPGFGKTTLISAWAAKSRLPLAWVSLDENDNDPIRFWSYLATSLMMVLPGLKASLTSLPQSAQLTDLEFYRQELLNQLAALEQPFLLILDDYHLIENASVHSALDHFIDHLLASQHVILLTRADPPLHLPRRRARGELVEIRAADLRFSRQETEDFLRHCMQLDLAREDLDALENRTEGWITGLQLAAISLRTIEDRHAFIQAFHGDDRLITDYLIEEVLQQQPEERQAFLLQTSVLRRFNAALCSALTGQRDSAHLLSQMENENLFLIPLDYQREWYRYHALFARLLQKKLEQSIGPQGIRDMLHRASDECIRQGLLVEGVQYLFTAGDLAGAALLIQRHVREIFGINELPTLVRWANHLPDEAVCHLPGLCIALGWAAHATGHLEKSQHFVDLVEAGAGISAERFLALPLDEQLGLSENALAAIVEAVVLKARLDIDRGITQEALDRYRRILPWLVPERDKAAYAYNTPSDLRPVMTFQVGMAYSLLGRADLACPAFEETVVLSKPLKNHFLVALSLGYLGQVKAQQGQLHKAEETWQAALDYANEHGVEKNAFFSVALVGLAGLAYERDDFTRAGQYLEDGIRLAKTWPAWQGLLPGLTLLSQVRQAAGDVSGAEKALDELSRFRQSAPQIINPAIDAYRALVWVRRGMPGRAPDWLEHGEPDHLDQRLIQAEGLAGMGKLPQALQQVDRAILNAEKTGQSGFVIRGLAIKAAALQAAGRTEPALAALHRSLHMAENEGYLRTFVDLSSPIETLLKKGVPPELEAYAARLLSAFPNSLDAGMLAAEQANTRLPNPLTSRELEILRLMASGKDNEAVSTQLYISIHTVKKHVTHLLAKLGVENRLQAVEKARRLGLLP